jgi:hypothetical protein
MAVLFNGYWKSRCLRFLIAGFQQMLYWFVPQLAYDIGDLARDIFMENNDYRTALWVGPNALNGAICSKSPHQLLGILLGTK